MSINRLVNNGDGTVTDTATSLMWTADTIGGDYNWEIVSSCFGEGRLIFMDSLQNEISPDTYYKYKGSSSHLHYDDWRLPTAEELKSLTTYNQPHLKEVFESSFNQSVWAANSAGSSAKGHQMAWALFKGVGVGDFQTSEKFSARLVRGGTIFNSTKSSKPGCPLVAVMMFLFIILLVLTIL